MHGGHFRNLSEGSKADWSVLLCSTHVTPCHCKSAAVLVVSRRISGVVSLYILYVWVSLFGAITASQAWSLASHVFDAREARRSFAWIGLGGVVGGIVGGSLARIVAPWLGTEVLLPICSALMIVTVVILHGLARREDWKAAREEGPETDKSKDSGLAVLAQIRQSPYLSMMVALLVSGVLVEAFVDYEFKVVAHQAFDSKDRLTSFFGTIASYGGMLALLVQTLVTGRLLKRFGVGAAIVLLPSALLAGFLLVAARPALWAVSILKLIDGSLSYSVHRSGMELLYVPIPGKVEGFGEGAHRPACRQSGTCGGRFTAAASYRGPVAFCSSAEHCGSNRIGDLAHHRPGCAAELCSCIQSSPREEGH